MFQIIKEDLTGLESNSQFFLYFDNIPIFHLGNLHLELNSSK